MIAPRPFGPKTWLQLTTALTTSLAWLPAHLSILDDRLPAHLSILDDRARCRAGVVRDGTGQAEVLTHTV